MPGPEVAKERGPGRVKSNPDPNNPPFINQFPSEGGPLYQNEKR
jgi:hypothetical protein